MCVCLGAFLLSLPVFLPCIRLLLRPRGGKEGSKFRHLRQVRRRRRVHQLPGMKCISSLNWFPCVNVCGWRGGGGYKKMKKNSMLSVHIFMGSSVELLILRHLLLLQLVQTGLWGPDKPVPFTHFPLTPPRSESCVIFTCWDKVVLSVMLIWYLFGVWYWCREHKHRAVEMKDSTLQSKEDSCAHLRLSSALFSPFNYIGFIAHTLFPFPSSAQHCWSELWAMPWGFLQTFRSTSGVSHWMHTWVMFSYF